MLAGFLFGLSQQRSPEESLAWATSCGALAVSREGTQTFDRSEAEALLDHVEIQEL
jgi:fructose-1-phosphate kinase PfkB-like protein